MNQRQYKKILKIQKANWQNACEAINMIWDALEELGPVGVLPNMSHFKYGPESIHDAMCIIEGIQKMAEARNDISIKSKNK
jgi:hypothetical protein